MIGPTVPRRIFQTWKTKDLPLHWQPSQDSIRRLMPDYDYHLLTDEDNRALVARYFPQYLGIYDAFPHDIQRADFIRPIVLYLFGGWYLDCDFVVRRRLDSVVRGYPDGIRSLDQPVKNSYMEYSLFVVPSGNIGSYYTNSVMASQPGHPFWLEYLAEMTQPAPVWAWGKHFEVMTTTGPMALTRALRKTRHGINLLPATLMMPCDSCHVDDPSAVSPHAVLTPLRGASWNGADSRLYNLALCHWRQIAAFVSLLVLLIVVARVVQR